MDDTLSLNTDAKKTSTTDWHFRAQSNVSMDAKSSKLSIQQNLFVLSTQENKTKRPLIPATFVQKLSYFSMYTCNIGKLEILCRQQNNVNRFFWLYVSNTLCKSLPMTYVYLFLSLYAPDYHFFISKMVPICYGCSWILTIAGIFQVIIMMNGSIMYFIYFITGIVYKLPWKKCDKNETVEDTHYNCYDLPAFSKKFKNGNISYDGGYYYSEDEYFTLAQIQYFQTVISNMEATHLWNAVNGIYSVVWLFTIFTYRQLYKERIWKVLYYSHMALCASLLAIFLHVVITFESTPIYEIISSDQEETEYLMNADIDLLAESMSAPPVVHLINSKSINQIKPSIGSGIITTSSAGMYIFKALTSYLMERHCERWVNATILFLDNDNSSFYVWPIYFATIYFGDFFVLVFFAINGTVSYCVALLTYHCVVETIQSEWNWIKSWGIHVVSLIIAFTDLLHKCHMIVEYNFIAWTGISTLAEVVILFWMYPLSRLVDDIMFHYGTPPTKLRVLNFKIVPIFYLIKIYIMYSRILMFDDFDESICYYLGSPRYLFCYICAVFCTGIAFSIYQYNYKRKKGLNQLFKPIPEWGPQDYVIRQLRKQFNSHEYIASQAPRDLSRHLINKAELRSYKVDIRYNSNSRRSMRTKIHEKLA